MTHRSITAASAALFATLLVSTAAVNAGKDPGKPLPDLPVSATFQDVLTSPNGGGIVDDGSTDPYSAFLWGGTGDLELRLIPGSNVGRSLTLWFTDLLEAGACVPSCKSFLVQQSVILDGTTAGGHASGHLKINLVDAEDNEIPGGIRDMPVGSTQKARFLVTLSACCDPGSVTRKNPSGTVAFVLRYWPAYQRAAYVNVTHPDGNHWIIESIDADGAADVDGLWDDAARLVRTNGVNPIYEDLWRMPFRMTVTRY